MRAKNGCVTVGGRRVSYVRFGSGAETLVLIPGVGDGLKTVKGMAVPMALMYPSLWKRFTVFMFSRSEPLPARFSTRQMAAELSEAMDDLGIDAAAVVGVSQGGMIAQYLAIDHPEQVKKLILTVTAGRPNDTVRQVLGRWIELAEQGDYRAIMTDNAERSYSEKRLRRMRPVYGLLGRVGKPKDFRRFITQAEACLGHDAWEDLPSIACPVLVIGVGADRIVTARASRELAERIRGAELVIYPQLSHALYEEAPDFWDRVKTFAGK